MDHYRRLQVTRDADPAVIERAYKALSLKYHPDHAPVAQRDKATRRMQMLNESYRVLKDPMQRRQYDATLPPEVGESGWDQFWERGLVGLFTDKFGRIPRR
ncbi:MAG: DnaJ domain-containing protein [Coriobacteriia bacterium]|nr:DnaJ domain-containing protein [Coriobacteriia bacterium]